MSIDTRCRPGLYLPGFFESRLSAHTSFGGCAAIFDGVGQPNLSHCQQPRSLMSIRPFLSVILCATALFCGATRAIAQPGTEAASDRLRIERLADAGRLWGYIKFVHPALAYRDIDWDQALIRALPAIRAARTAEDYAAA